DHHVLQLHPARPYRPVERAQPLPELDLTGPELPALQQRVPLGAPRAGRGALEHVARAAPEAGAGHRSPPEREELLVVLPPELPPRAVLPLAGNAPDRPGSVRRSGSRRAARSGHGRGGRVRVGRERRPRLSQESRSTRAHSLPSRSPSASTSASSRSSRAGPRAGP